MSITMGESVTIRIPDFDSLTDGELAEISNMRDGRWSDQTKALMTRFGATKLDLNSGWASTWTGWICPCCKRDKPQIGRMSPGGVLLLRLEYHHDHLVDHAKRVYGEHNPRGEDQETNIQVSRAKDALMPFIERFEKTLICIDCNLAEGRAKLDLAKEMDGNFTFAPSEIASFISAFANRLHDVDVEKARLAWHAAKEDFTDRVDFARRMAHRIASGRHRREVAAGQRLLGPLQDRDIIYRLFSESAPVGYRHRLGLQIEVRSVSNDSAGHSPKPKRKPKARPPTDTEFAAIEAAQQASKTWMSADQAWQCPCCGRSKREICRKSNKGRWTVRIHRIVEFELEQCEESLERRRKDSASQFIVGSCRSVLICHDCRNIVAEVQRRRPGLCEQSLTVADLIELVGGATPHEAHDVDFDQAILMAIANNPLLDAIEDYDNHRTRAVGVLSDVKRMMKLMNWPPNQARDIIGYEIAKENDWDLDEGDAYADWLLEEARRLLSFDEMSS